ncbi:MAG: hypothetical protein ABL861_07985 [Nitrosomonas sp.]
MQERRCYQPPPLYGAYADGEPKQAWVDISTSATTEIPNEENLLS